MEIVQRSLVKSLSRCGDGVELLEASVKDINPRNLRRHISFIKGNKKTSRYPQDRAPAKASASSDENVENDAMEESYAEEIAGGHVDSDEEVTSTVTNHRYDIYDEEMDAPWNQHAWIEEMKLRVSGSTKFDAPMQRSSAISRLLFGNSYRRTTSKGRQSVFQMVSPWGGGGEDEDGIDDYDNESAAGLFGRFWKKSRTLTAASNKPHAVIADGEAMQRVPGSLRELVRCCRAADVPLYIVNDP